MASPSENHGSWNRSQNVADDGEEASGPRNTTWPGLRNELTSMERLLKIGFAMTREETIALRSRIVPRSCALHFEKSPMKVIFGQGQYLYDDLGVEYLDCANCVAHVGHCHPEVVKAGKEAMAQTGAVPFATSSSIGEEYIQSLKRTLPPQFDTFLFLSSASEANDLALRLARLYTGGTEVIAVERSYHGSLTLPITVSPRIHVNQSSSEIPDWVHVLPCPDLYHGKYREDDSLAVDKYCSDARDVIAKCKRGESKLAGLICEPILSIAGIIVPPTKWMKSIYQEIRAAGGVVIADEAQTGMGRCGTAWWAFQYQEVVPDIITVGKPLGNGHPMAMVVTKQSIATCLGQEELASFAIDQVSASIGAAVVKVIKNENLQLNARNVGTFLREGLKGLANERRYIGDVRGVGLMVGVEIVYSKENRKPAKDIAEKICYMLKDNNIVMGNDGIHKNVLIIMPPMTFTCENAHRVILTLDKILRTIEEDDDELLSQGPSTSSNSYSRSIFGFEGAGSSRSGGLLPSSIFDDSAKISMADMGLEAERPSRYSEMD